MRVSPPFIVLPLLFALELFWLANLPVLGVTVPITLFGLVWLYDQLSLRGILVLSALFGYIADVAVGVQRLTHLASFLLVGILLCLLKIRYQGKQLSTMGKTGVLGIAILTFQLVPGLAGGRDVLELWLWSLAALLMVAVGLVVAFSVMESFLRRILS